MEWIEQQQITNGNTFIFKYKFKVGEMLFKPDIFYQDPDKDEMIGIHEMIYSLIVNLKGNDKVKEELCGNIVMTGGCTLIKNMAERLEYELDFIRGRHLLVNGYLRDVWRETVYMMMWWVCYMMQWILIQNMFLYQR